MPVVIAWLFVIALFGCLAWAWWDMFNTPTRGLRRDFRKLRRSILRRIGPDQRHDAKLLLADCQRHIEAMCSVQHEHEIIGRLVDTTEQLSKVKAVEARQRINAFRTAMSVRLAETFAAMSRLSVAAELDLDDPVAALRDFSKQLEAERHTLANSPDVPLELWVIEGR